MTKITDAPTVTELDDDHRIPLGKVGAGPLNTTPEAILAKTGVPDRVDALEQAMADLRADLMQKIEDLKAELGGGGTTPPATTLPTMSINPASRTVTEGAIPSELATITLSGPPPSGVEPVPNPNDGRIAYSTVSVTNGVYSFKVLKGLTASGVGTQEYTTTLAKAGATNSPQTVNFTLTVQAAVVDPPVDPNAPEFGTYARVYDPNTRIKEAQSTVSPGAGIVVSPEVLQPTTTGDVMGFNFEAGSAALPARMMQFAFHFAPGAIGVNQPLEVVYGGATYPVQVHPLAVHPDNKTSIDHALLTVRAPALAAAQVVKAIIRKASAAPTGANVAITAASVASSGITGTIAYKNRRGNGRRPDDSQGGVWNPAEDAWTLVDDGAIEVVNQTFDISPAYMVANGILTSTRYEGPLATERRYQLDLGNANRFTMDIIAYNDGTFDIDCETMSDLCNRPNVSQYGSYLFDWNMKQGGTNVLNLVDWRNGARMGFGKRIQTAYSAAINGVYNVQEHAIQFDAEYLKWLAVVPSYKLDTGVLQTKIDALTATNMRAPHDTCRINSPGMGGTGDNENIAYLTQPQSIWVKTMSYKARGFVLGQAEAWRALQTSVRDGARNWISLNNFPDTGIPGLWTGVFPFRYTADAWEMDNSLPFEQSIRRDYDIGHGPLVPYLAYMITGRRMYGDLVEQQGAHSVHKIYGQPRYRAIGSITYDWCIVQEDQPRTAGWACRDCSMNQRALPDSSFLKIKLLQVLNYSFAYLNTKITKWKQYQGQAFGWLAEANPYDKDNLKNFMQDHFFLGNYSAVVMSGSPQAWSYMQNFSVNWQSRSWQDPAVLPLTKASCFNFFNGNSHDVDDPSKPLVATTWSELAAVSDNQTPNRFAEGNMTQITTRGLMLIATLFEDTTQAKALDAFSRYHALEGLPGAFISLSDFRNDPKDDYTYIRRLDSSGGGGTPEPTLNPPEPAASQTFSAQTTGKQGDKVGDFAWTGGTPTSGAITNTNGSTSAVVAVANGDDLVLAKDLAAEAATTRNLRVALSNADGTSGWVPFTFAIIQAAASAQNIFGFPDADIAWMYSAARRLAADYSATGPLSGMKMDSDPTERLVNMTGGLADKAAYLAASAGGWDGYVTTLYDQSAGRQNIVMPVASAPQVIREQGLSDRWARPSISIAFNRVPKLLNFAPGGRGLGVAMPAFTEFSDEYTTYRWLSLTANGQTNDYDNDASACVLGFRDRVATERSKNGEVIGTYAAAALPEQSNNFLGSGYLSDGTSFIQQNGTVLDGGTFTAPFGTGTLRIGAMNDAGDGNHFGIFPEIVILRNPSKANIAAIYANQKAFYGLP